MIHFRLFGGVALCDAQGRELRSILAQPKRLALLAYLAISGRLGPTRRDTLLALFWPELDDARARNSLNKAVHFLRRALGDGAIVSRSTDELALDDASVWSDVRAFEGAADASRLEEALRLYQGELLPGFFVQDAAGFEDWLERERTRLRQRAARVAGLLTEQCEAAGNHAIAVTAARRAVELAPDDERAVRRLMTILARLGDRSGALQTYEGFARALASELGAQPSAETTRLAEQIRRDAPTGTLTEQTLGSVPDADSAPVLGRSDRSPLRANRRWPFSPRAIAAGVTAVALGTGGWWAAARPVKPATSFDSIVVLPATADARGQPEEYVVQGIHEQLVARLSRVRNFTVISRESALRFGRSPSSMAAIAKALAVKGIVTVSVAGNADTVRIAVGLVPARDTARPSWQRTYVSPTRELSAVLTDITRDIVEHSVAGLTRADRVRLTSDRPVDPAAYDAYLRARFYQHGWTDEGARRASQLYQDAIAKDGLWALPYAGLAEMQAVMLAWGRNPPDQIYPVWEAAATRALQLDSTLGEAHAQLGAVKLQQWEWARAELELRRALELAPASLIVHENYAYFLEAMNWIDEAIRQRQHALRVDPLSAGANIGLAVALFRARRYAESNDQLRRTLELFPNLYNLHVLRALNFALSNRLPEAVNEADQGFASAPSLDDPWLLGMGGWAYAVCGRRAQARTLFERLESLSAERYVDPAYQGAILIGLGEIEKAILWLERSHATKSPVSIVFQVDPWLDAVRSNPRFQELIRTMGFPARSGRSAVNSADSGRVSTRRVNASTIDAAIAPADR